ncbi:P-loop containing nucleoside triphosphate hydrolase protein [Fimicolochytrium jonesii]|uniref:P-loop containing nucleoside triphosphate hydrolase protein n=1 Tax=Fimicolochytrium jonesii TaxID=1396493 RepID=UPI0022FEF230|nr:P-loop containing nucleoside triphosphate hydrolase protein [Fimicolochytrium jonesii]KAI8817235.1 P-loop containing nucleoside triphosphate hydrolase protein [Fimicolochytrium jonesii]
MTKTVVEEPSPKTSELGASQYAKKAKDLVALITKIRQHGGQIELSLPRIAVIGNQSAGKSSVVEAISGIPLPRASGTCTRSPIEVRMEEKPGTAWSCQVVLRWESDENEKQLLNTKEEPFDTPMTKEADVGLRIAQAQRAILNPGTDSAYFLKMNEKDLKKYVDKRQFTSNIIVVAVTGPDVLSLTLIDLPGIIQTPPQDAKEDLVGLIKQLVTKYIEDKRTIILKCVTCADDVNNQESVRFARTYDATGERTVCALTKADLIERSCHAPWMNFLLHGKPTSFAVVNPAPDRLDRVTSREARDAESQFFKNTEPWNTVPPLNHVLGVQALAQHLSVRLTQLIKSTFPDMKATAKQLLKEVNNDLKQLPAVPSNSLYDLRQAIKKLRKTIHTHVYAQHGYPQLWQTDLSLYQEFRDDIQATRPKLAAPTEKEIEESDKVEETRWKMPRTTYTLAYVHKIIDVYKGRQMGGEYNEQSFHRIIETFMEVWPEISQYYMGRLVEDFNIRSDRWITDSFARFKPLLLETRLIVDDLQKDLFKETADFVLEFFTLESYPPFTLDPVFHDKSAALYKTYETETARWDLKETVPESNEDRISEAIALLKEANLTDLTVDDLYVAYCRKQGNDHTTALRLISRVQAFFDVAAQRFVDHVAMAIDTKYVIGMEKHLEERLEKQLATDQQRAAELLVEDDRVAEKRKELMARKERLENVLKEMMRLTV